MRFLALLFVLPLAAQDLSLERLYSRPRVWGTQPDRIRWARNAPVLGFVWNAQGGRFLDAYAYHAAGKRLVRLTDLESAVDELNRTEEEKDDRRRAHMPPAAGVSDLQLSADGALAAIVHRGDIYIADTAGAKPLFRLTHTKTPETAPRFSPDKRKLAFLCGGQLFVQDLSNGQLEQITDIDERDGALAEYSWSPDGARFLLTVMKGTRRRVPLPNYSGRLVTANGIPRTLAGEDPGERAYWLVSAKGGAPRVVESGGIAYAPEPPAWSPDSQRVLFCAVAASMKKLQIRVADAETGKTTVVNEDEDTTWVYWPALGWSPDSKQVWFLSERDGRAHLYAVAAGGGAARQITRGNFEVHPDMFGAPPVWAGEWIYFGSTEPVPSERHYYRIHPDGTGKQRLSQGAGVHIGMASHDGRHIAWKRSTPAEPFDLWVDDARVTKSPAPEFYKAWWPETRFVTFPSPVDRKMVSAKLLLPRGYDPAKRDGKKWPAVFFIHGAGYATSVLAHWGSYAEPRYAFNCYLAARGYVILDIDYRGSSGYGRDWRTDVYLHLGGKDLEDLLGGVEYLKSLGNIDTAKLGAWGASYGGFLTNMAMFAAPDAFRAGSAWAAVNDWENYNAFYTTQRLNTPRANPEAYRRSAPITYSHNLKGRLLMVHGMGDSNVMFQDAVQLTEKLIQEGKDFGQAFYPQEDHSFVRDESLIDAFRRTAEWFDTYLK